MNYIDAEAHIRARASVALGPMPLQMAIAVTPGVGKTEMALRVAATFADQLSTKRLHIFVPDNKMTGEVTERARALFPANVHVRFHRGRTDTRLGPPLCHPSMEEKANLATELGASVAELVCPTCLHAENCGWLEQNRDDGPGVVIMPNKYASLPIGARCDIAIFDEEFLLGLETSVEVEVDRLLAHPDLPKVGSRWKEGSPRYMDDFVFLLNVKDRLRRACDDGKKIPNRSELRAAGLTAADAKRAKGIEYGRHDALKEMLAQEIEKGGTPDEIRLRIADARKRYGDARRLAAVYRSLESS